MTVAAFHRRRPLTPTQARAASPSLTLRAAFGLALLIHLATICIVFPVSKLLDTDLPYHVDYAYWLYNSTTMDSFLKDSWQMWGYNPYLSAGYPEGGVVRHLAHHGGRAWELLVHLLGSISFPAAFKLYPFLCMVLPPLVIWWTCKALKFTNRQAALAGIITIFYWWSSQLSVLAVDRGTVSSPLATFVALPLIVWFALFCRTPTVRHAVALLLTSIVGLWLHPYTAAIVAIPIVVIYAYHFQRLSGRHHLVLAGVLLLTAISTLPWTTQLLTVRYHDFSPTVYPYDVASLGLRIFIQNVLGLSGPLFISLPACFGLRRWYREGHKDLAVAWVAGLVFLIFVTYLGSTIVVPHIVNLQELENWQPARFEVVCYVMLILPWAHGLADTAAWLRGDHSGSRIGDLAQWLRKNHDRPGPGALAAWLTRDRGQPAARVVVIVLLAGSFIHSSWRYLEHAVYDPVVLQQRVVVPMSSTGDAFIAWTRNNTTKGGRILFEDRINWEDGYNLVPGLLALRSDREFIGGPYWDLSQSHAIFSTYVDGWLFGRSIDTFPVAELRDYLDLYNIQWVACVSDISVTYLDSHPETFQRTTTIGPMKIYAVARSTSFFQQGTGDIDAGFNRLSLKQMQVGEQVVLRYHWQPSLKSSDGSPIRGVRLLDDPNEFIALVPRSADLTIYNSYTLPEGLGRGS